jgi:hypothetical protein
MRRVAAEGRSHLAAAMILGCAIDFAGLDAATRAPMLLVEVTLVKRRSRKSFEPCGRGTGEVAVGLLIRIIGSRG